MGSGPKTTVARLNYLALCFLAVCGILVFLMARHGWAKSQSEYIDREFDDTIDQFRRRIDRTNHEGEEEEDREAEGRALLHPVTPGPR